MSCGVCYVRHGKAQKGSPPKRRSVLTVWDWVAEVAGEWVSEIRPLVVRADGNPALWPPERAGRIGLRVASTTRFAAYRDALGLTDGLDFHSLRRSYVTHLIEDGLGPALRPAAGRPRARQHHLDLHLRVVGLPHPDGAPRAGRDPDRRAGRGKAAA